MHRAIALLVPREGHRELHEIAWWVAWWHSLPPYIITSLQRAAKPGTELSLVVIEAWREVKSWVTRVVIRS
jgi:hypothetical protein